MSDNQAPEIDPLQLLLQFDFGRAILGNDQIDRPGMPFNPPRTEETIPVETISREEKTVEEETYWPNFSSWNKQWKDNYPQTVAEISAQENKLRLALLTDLTRVLLRDVLENIKQKPSSQILEKMDLEQITTEITYVKEACCMPTGNQQGVALNSVVSLMRAATTIEERQALYPALQSTVNSLVLSGCVIPSVQQILPDDEAAPDCECDESFGCYGC